MTGDPLVKARAKLASRQGPGARTDAQAAPAMELDWARRGTAYFARLLNQSSDTDLDENSALAGWSRRQIISQVAYHARHMAELIGEVRATARTDESSVGLSVVAKTPDEQVQAGARLPSHALRYLFKHASVHLDVEWRDLTDNEWTLSATDRDGVRVALASTPRLRAELVWAGALAMGREARLQDIPADFKANLLLGAWSFAGQNSNVV